LPELTCHQLRALGTGGEPNAEAIGVEKIIQVREGG